MAGNLIFSTPVHAKLHHMDGLTLSGLKEFLKAKEHHAKDFNTVTLGFGHVQGVVTTKKTQ
ncbi:hypothetical protein PanWU01x14_314800 [Parasponia andersonii]|uniref:Uncharacterized protein n=1 Tax=Parasponia andersonii TaxID=3476 RepID=A0A2P5ANL6_PARAD|nr:hypothetical protein PanWU01x14_314800 [Parasponia andersonii]